MPASITIERISAMYRAVAYLGVAAAKHASRVRSVTPATIFGAILKRCRASPHCLFSLALTALKTYFIPLFSLRMWLCLALRSLFYLLPPPSGAMAARVHLALLYGSAALLLMPRGYSWPCGTAPGRQTTSIWRNTVTLPRLRGAWNICAAPGGGSRWRRCRRHNDISPGCRASIL